MSKQLYQLILRDEEDIGAIKYLLQKGADVNYIHQEIFKLSKRAQVVQNTSLLHAAVAQGKPETLKVLLSQPKVNVEVLNEKGNTPLILAVDSLKESKKIIPLLLDKKPNLDYQNPNGDTALHFAAERGNPDIIKMLTTAGCKLDIKNKKGNTPLHTAAYFRAAKVINVFVQLGLNINQPNNEGNTPLHLACQRNDSNTIKELLLNKGINLSLKNSSGRTAIEEAAFYGSANALKTLMESTGSTLSTNQKENLCNLATQQGQVNVLQYLQREIPLIVNKNQDALKILQYPDLDFMSEMCNQFNKGFNKIEYDGGKLSFARIKEKRGDDYEIYIINSNEFNDFLELIKTRAALSPQGLTRINFTIVDTHWVTGSIEIENGKINLCLMDSLGAKETPNIYFENVIDVIPEAKLYEIKDTRQYDLEACSVFAIDDVDHLYTVDKYLPKKFQNSGLFGYLEANKVGTKTLINENNPNDKNVYNVVQTQLPVHMIRATQSLGGIEQRLNWIEKTSSDEARIPVKKGGANIRQSIKQHTVKIGEKEQNRRINFKLDRITTKNRDFILQHDKKYVEEKMDSVTLKGLEAKNQLLKSKQPKPM